MCFNLKIVVMKKKHLETRTEKNLLTKKGIKIWHLN